MVNRISLGKDVFVERIVWSIIHFPETNMFPLHSWPLTLDAAFLPMRAVSLYCGDIDGPYDGLPPAGK